MFAVDSLRYESNTPCPHHPSNRVRYRANHKCVPCALEGGTKSNLRARAKCKLECLEAYGGACCARCDETNIDVLTIEHKHNDGTADRVALTGKAAGGGRFYQVLRAAGFPNKDRYAVLCRNCNHRAYLEHRQRQREALWASWRA
jgi:hypothetical protein